MSLTTQCLGARGRLTLVLLAVALAACSDPQSNRAPASSAQTSSAESAATRSLALSGNPPAAASVGSPYSFQPTASGATDTVGYSVRNLPAWASFSTVTGQLQGTPTAANVGVYKSILIRASDGGQSAALPAFSVTVAQAIAIAPSGPGSATLAWSPPVSNTDGTPLADLAGFYIYYGTDSSQLSQLIDDETGDLNSGGYTITGLAPGTYYFQVSAYTALGVQGAPSNQVSVTITS